MNKNKKGQIKLNTVILTAIGLIISIVFLGVLIQAITDVTSSEVTIETTTIKQIEQYTDNGEADFGSSTKDTMATTFTANGTYTVSSITVKMKKAGTPTLDVNMTLWTFDATTNTTDVFLDISSTIVNGSNITTSFQNISFDFPNTQLNDGVKYVMALQSLDNGGGNNYRANIEINAPANGLKGANGVTVLTIPDNGEVLDMIFRETLSGTQTTEDTGTSTTILNLIPLLFIILIISAIAIILIRKMNLR